MMEIDSHKRRLFIHTSMPGHIVSYDAATRRARVQPALFIVLTDETPIRRPPILNVPVVQQSGHGMLGHTPLRAGDPVWLNFSERGITEWKKNVMAEVMPDKGHYFNEADAVAFPGFSASTTAPVIEDGFSFQTEDGVTHVTIKENEVVVEAQNVIIRNAMTITIMGGNVIIQGDTTINGSHAANGDVDTQSASGPGAHTHGLTAL